MSVAALETLLASVYIGFSLLCLVAAILIIARAHVDTDETDDSDV